MFLNFANIVLVLCISIAIGPSVFGQQDKKKTATDEYSAVLQEYRGWYENAARAQLRGDYAGALNSYYALINDIGQRVSPYWIGVQCESAGEVPILSEIPSIGRLFHKGGLRVNSVTDESPAHIAGLKKGDFIIALNGKAVNEISELLIVIGEAKTNNINVQIVRADGKSETLKITPAKRPARSDKQRKPADDASNRVWQNYWHAQRLDPRNSGNASFWLRAVNAYNQLPDDVEITLIKKGKNPPSIVVKRGDKEWRINSEGDVRKLPTDIQTYVSGLRDATATKIHYDRFRYFAAPNIYRGFNYRDVASALDKAQNKTEDKSNLLKRIEGISKQLDELRKSVDELKDKQ